MASLFSEGFETGPSGAALTTTNTTFTAVTASGFSFTASPTPAVGALAATASTPTTAANRLLEKTFTAAAAVYHRQYINIPANPGAAVFLGSMLSTATVRAGLRLNAAGTLTLRNNTVAVYTSTQVLPLGVWVRIEWRVDNTAAAQELRVFSGANLHGTTPDWTSGVQTYNSGTIDKVQAGFTTAVASFTATFDAMAADDTTWVGPAATTPPPDPAVPTDPAALGYIGDSLTYQDGSTAARDTLIAAGWPDTKTRVDGLIGRAIIDGTALPSSQEVVNSWRADGFDPKTWIIALGSNNVGATDANWVNWCGQMLDLIAAGEGPYVVYWVGIAFRDDPADTRTSRFQAVLDGLVGARPNIDLRPLDWNAYVHNGRDETGLWQTGDATGRHMTPTGYALRNNYVTTSTTVVAARIVDRWTGTALVRQRIDRWNGTALVQQALSV